MKRLLILLVLLLATTAWADQFQKHIINIDTTIKIDTLDWCIYASTDSSGILSWLPATEERLVCDTTYDDKVQVWLKPDQLKWLREYIFTEMAWAKYREAWGGVVVSTEVNKAKAEIQKRLEEYRRLNDR